MKLLSGLGLAASIVLACYVALRLGDLAVRGELFRHLDGSALSWWFGFELLFSAIVPAALLAFRRVRTSLAGLSVCATLVVLGMVLYQTVTAVNGRDGLEKARAERPDLVTLDITMPEKSGIKFYRELKDDPELAATPVIIVTAVTGYGGDPDVFRKFISTRKQVPPPEAFVTKPINADDFVKTVAKVLS